jgi:hypothetical protein
MSEPRAGDVYFVLARASLARDKKDRRCPLLADCQAEDAATLAYSSTQYTEAAGKDPAIFVIVPPRGGFESNGFSAESLVFPGILTVVDVDDLDTLKGALSQSELDAIISAMPLRLASYQPSMTLHLLQSTPRMKPVW